MVSITSSGNKRGGVVTLSSKVIVGAFAFLLLSTVMFYSKILTEIGSNKMEDAIFVISLQGTPSADSHNEGRLDAFKDAWKKNSYIIYIGW